MRLLYAAFGITLLGWVGLIYSVMRPSLRYAHASNCYSNLHQIGLAMQAYAREHNGQYPVAARWTDDLQPYVEIGEKERTPKNLDRAFRCATTGEFYVLNSFFARANLADDFNPATSPLAFCARTSERNFTDGGSLWPIEPIHKMGNRSGNIVVFADAHVKMLEGKPKFRELSPKLKPTPTARPTTLPQVER